MSRFGRSTTGTFGTAIQRNGIEISAAAGAPVHAVHGGTIAYAAPFTGYGVLVIVDHGAEAFTVYGHLAGTALRPGATVTRGQSIGAAGMNPAGQGATYFEVRDRRSSGESPTMAQDLAMTTRTRLIVLCVSIPVLAFAVVGGALGRTALAQGESYRYLRIFQDVVTLIVDNYVEEVNVDKVMHGAMHGLADGLDPDSAYLDVEQMKALEHPAADVAQPGLELTRQYYLRVIAARDGSPAAKAGLQTGRLRAIDRRSVHARHVGVRRRASAAWQTRNESAPGDLARQRRGAARDRAGTRDVAGSPRAESNRRAGQRLPPYWRVLKTDGFASAGGDRQRHARGRHAPGH